MQEMGGYHANAEANAEHNTKNKKTKIRIIGSMYTRGERKRAPHTTKQHTPPLVNPQSSRLKMWNAA